VDAQVVGTVATLFTTARADVCTLRAAVSVIANHLRAVDAGLAVQTEIALSARTVNTPITAFADLILGTVGAFLHAVLADLSAVIAARSTIAYVFTAAADTTVFTPPVITNAADTEAAVGTDVPRTVQTLFSAAGTDIRTVVTALAAVTNDGTGAAGVAV